MGLRITALASLLLASSIAAADVTDEQTFTYTLDQGGRISLENINGSVEVTGGDGDQVVITAFKKAENREYLDGIEINIDASPAHIRIETEHPDSSGFFKWKNGNDGQVRYTLSVPAWAELDSIESVNGSVTISGVYGTVKAETVNGDIEASDLSSDAKLDTVNGSVEAHFTSLSGDQKVNCETVNGRVAVYLPENADASITAESVNGGIDGKDFDLRTDKGFIGQDLKGDVGDGSARVDLNTVNGAIKIRKS